MPLQRSAFYPKPTFAAIHNGQGRVRIGDSLWIARGPDVPAGSQVVVVSADGSALNVEPVG